jgi:hypothetical protein
MALPLAKWKVEERSSTPTITILELDAEGLEEHGKRKSGLMEVAVGEDLTTGPKAWRRATSFAERL